MKTELELRHLRVFVTVVDAGGYTKASKLLGISQSTVSETIGALERTLGTPLFRKVTKQLTPSGEALLPHARRVLALTAELLTDLAAVSSQVSATLVVAAVESLCAYVLPGRLAALRERWPNVRLEVTTGVCADIRESVAAGKSDVGLLIEAASDDDGVLARSHLVVFGHPRHALAGQVVAPDDLRRCDFFMSDAAGSYHQVLRQHFEAAELPVPRTQALGTIEGVKRGILAGGGALGLLPAYAVAAELRDGTLVEVTPQPLLTPLVLRAICGANAGSPVVDDLLQSLSDQPL